MTLDEDGEENNGADYSFLKDDAEMDNQTYGSL